MGVLLEVVVRHARDVPGCLEGGADRLLLDTAGIADVATVSAVVRAGGIPVRVRLPRAAPGTERPAGLAAIAEEHLRLGAEGVALGILDADLEVDVEGVTEVTRALPGVPWTFDGVDDSLDPRRSWRRLLTAPGLTAVTTAGSPLGLDHGYDALLAQVEADPEIARLAMPSGGLRPDQVPWLVRAGVRQVSVAEQVRPGGSERAYVDAGLVRSWRLLLDGLDGLGAAPSSGPASA